MQRGFAEECTERASGIRTKIIQMPFLLELANGTLPEKKFQFYIIQGFLYLKQYARVLAMLGSQAAAHETSQHLIRAALNTLGESALNIRFFDKFGLPLETVESTELSPTCAGYLNFLLSCQAQSFEVGFAAILPCFTIYNEVFQHIKRLSHDAALSASNPYADWIETYGGEDFNVASKCTAALVDKAAESVGSEKRSAMERAFLTAVRFEYMFWNSAYHMEQWPMALDGSEYPPT